MNLVNIVEINNFFMYNNERRIVTIKFSWILVLLLRTRENLILFEMGTNITNQL